MQSLDLAWSPCGAPQPPDVPALVPKMLSRVEGSDPHPPSSLFTLLCQTTDFSWASLSLWRAGGGSAPIYVNRGGCVRWRGPPEGSSVCAQKAPARLGFPGALPQRRVVWMWVGAFPGAFGLGRAQPQRSQSRVKMKGGGRARSLLSAPLSV